MRLVMIAFMMLANTTCGSDPLATAPEKADGVTESVWGSDVETFELLSDRAVYEGVCVVGSTDDAVRIAASGEFAASGTLRRHGGARLEEEVAEQRVSYRGRVDGDVMTFSIWGADGTKRSESTLRRGVRGVSRPCA